MDSHTHVELALRLMDAIDAPRSLAIASLFPQIDREPPTLHRLHAHTVFKAQPLCELGLRLLRGEALSEQERDSFEGKRFNKESIRFKQFLSRMQAGSLPSMDEKNEAAAMVAFVSHPYLDTFNQPTQAFNPVSVYCSGQWNLWQEIGDFRLRLYTTSRIDRLRNEMLERISWPTARWEPAALIESMLTRLCELGLNQTIPQSLVGDVLGATGMKRASPQAIASSYEFLKHLEEILCELHQKHLVATAPDSSESAAPEMGPSLW